MGIGAEFPPGLLGAASDDEFNRLIGAMKKKEKEESGASRFGRILGGAGRLVAGHFTGGASEAAIQAKNALGSTSTAKAAANDAVDPLAPKNVPKNVPRSVAAGDDFFKEALIAAASFRNV